MRKKPNRFAGFTKSELESIRIGLHMRRCLVETGTHTHTAEEAEENNQNQRNAETRARENERYMIPVKPLSIEQMKLVIELRELWQEALEAEPVDR